MSVIRRGEIHYVKSFNTNVGSEQGTGQSTGRPAVVVSNNEQNKSSTVIQVVYMTTAGKKKLPTHVELGPRSPEKVRGSTVLVENVHSISIERLDVPYSYAGRVSEEDMQAIDRALLIGLDLERYCIGSKEKKAEPEKCQEGPGMAKPVVSEEVMVPAPEPAASEEVMALKVAADFYKQQYEALLDRVLKKARV